MRNAKGSFLAVESYDNASDTLFGGRARKRERDLGSSTQRVDGDWNRFRLLRSYGVEGLTGSKYLDCCQSLPPLVACIAVPDFVAHNAAPRTKRPPFASRAGVLRRRCQQAV